MAHLLIIELPGGNDADIIDSALARGDSFTFLSAQLSHYQRQPAVAAKVALASHQIEVAPFDYPEVERRVLAHHACHPIDAVLCLIDIRMVEAAQLAHRLGLRFLNPAGATLLRDKYMVRCRLAERGMAQPDFALATSNESLKQAVVDLGLPVLIKPVDGYGSQNIVALQHPDDLDPLLTPLEDMLPSRADYGLGVQANDRLLVERHMNGRVIGCDTFSVNGQHCLLGVNDKLFFEAPSFAIRGGCFTPRQPSHADLEAYVFALLEAVGFDWGATHIELMLTADGPQLIEINPRLVGAKIPRLLNHALGCSVHADLIALHAGEELATPVHETGMVAVTRWIAAERAGVIDRVTLPDWHDPRIRCVEVLKQPGDSVRPPFDNADRIGYVMVCAPGAMEAEALADAYVSAVRVSMRELMVAVTHELNLELPA